MKPFIISLIYLAFSCIVSTAQEAPAKVTVNRVIAIQPFEGIPAEHAKEAQKALKTYYKCEVKILPQLKLPPTK